MRLNSRRKEEQNLIVFMKIYKDKFINTLSAKSTIVKAYRMQNNIPTLFVLKLDSYVVKSAKISTILCLFVQKIKNVDRIAMVTVTHAM